MTKRQDQEDLHTRLCSFPRRDQRDDGVMRLPAMNLAVARTFDRSREPVYTSRASIMLEASPRGDIPRVTLESRSHLAVVKFKPISEDLYSRFCNEERPPFWSPPPRDKKSTCQMFSMT